MSWRGRGIVSGRWSSVQASIGWSAAAAFGLGAARQLRGPTSPDSPEGGGAGPSSAGSRLNDDGEEGLAVQASEVEPLKLESGVRWSPGGSRETPPDGWLARPRLWRSGPCPGRRSSAASSACVRLRALAAAWDRLASACAARAVASFASASSRDTLRSRDGERLRGSLISFSAASLGDVVGPPSSASPVPANVEQAAGSDGAAREGTDAELVGPPTDAATTLWRRGSNVAMSGMTCAPCATGGGFTCSLDTA